MCLRECFQDRHGIALYCHDLYPVDFGVLIPRKMASRQPEKWAYACIDPIYIITRSLAPDGAGESGKPRESCSSSVSATIRMKMM